MSDILKNVRECVDGHKRNPADPLTALESSMAERILTLEEERDALLQDALRYRWLRNESENHPSGPWPIVWDDVLNHHPFDNYAQDNDTHPCVYDELDAAIDAAMKADKLIKDEL